MADVEKKADEVSPVDTEKGAASPQYVKANDPGAKVDEKGSIDVMFKHANKNDADEAMKAFAGREGEPMEITPEMERKLLRKIDWNLMPVRTDTSDLIPTFY